jgi:hypothetical protein
MPMRLANIVCGLTILLAMVAMVGSLLNAGHFTGLPIARGLTLIAVAVGARSGILRAKAKRARQSGQATTEQPPRT